MPEWNASGGHVIKVGPNADVRVLLRECQANPGSQAAPGILEIREDQRPGEDHEAWLYLRVGAEDLGYVVQWIPAPAQALVPSSPDVEEVIAGMAARFNRMAVAFRLLPEAETTEGGQSNGMMANFYEIVARMLAEREPSDEAIAAMMERGARG